MGELRARLIDFEDIKPKAALLNECAGAIGIDSDERVYFAAQDYRKPGDVLIFRYNTRDDSRELLGSLREITASLGNLGPNEFWDKEESIAKIHVPFLEHEGKIYFGSHDFADPEMEYPAIYDELHEHRGAHLYAFDPATDTFEDLTCSTDGGVAIPQQSIVSIDVLEDENLLVAFSFPCGDLIVHDIGEGKTCIHSGMPEYRMDLATNVSRTIIASNKDKAYVSYAADDFWLREIDIRTGSISKTRRRNILQNGFISGMAKTRDRSVAYLMGLTGNLYAFHLKEERLEDLGSLLPTEDIARGDSVTNVHGLILSLDEKKIYSMPSRVDNEPAVMRHGMRFLTMLSPKFKNFLKKARLRFLQGSVAKAAGQTDSGTALYEYDIASGKRTILARFPSLVKGAWITGSRVVDTQGRLYLCYHTRLKNSARLIQITGLGDL